MLGSAHINLSWCSYAILPGIPTQVDVSWWDRRGTNKTISPEAKIAIVCSLRYHPESSTYWATSTLGSPQSWSKVERVLSFQNVPKGCEKCWWLCTPHRLFTGGWLDIFVLGSVVVHVSAVLVSSIAEYIHTQRNMYI